MIVTVHLMHTNIYTSVSTIKYEFTHSRCKILCKMQKHFICFKLNAAVINAK